MIESAENVTEAIYILLRGGFKELPNFLKNLTPGPTLYEDVLSSLQFRATT